LRDTAGLVVDTVAFDPISYVHDPRDRNLLRVTKFIDKRAQYLPASDLLDEAALDPYAFMRDAYMQRRAAQIADSNGGNAHFDDEVDDAPAQELAPAPAP
jgi:phospholipid-binding lipoprotein MlaA